MGSSTNSTIILSVFTFYLVIIVLMGFIGSEHLKSAIDPDHPPSGALSDIGFFISGIGFSISELGVWNVAFFLPLSITVAYILVSLARGSS